MKKRSARFFAGILVLVLVLSGCTAGGRAKQTIRVQSLQYGVAEPFGLYKLVLSVGQDYSIHASLYDQNALNDSLMPTVGRVSPERPLATAKGVISPTTWKTLLESESLTNLWRKPLWDTEPAIASAAVLFVQPETGGEHRLIGGHAINNQALYEVGEILRELARQEGLFAALEAQMNRHVKEELEEEATEEAQKPDEREAEQEPSNSKEEPMG